MLKSFYSWFMSRPRPKPEDDPHGKWGYIVENFHIPKPNVKGGSYAQIEICRNYNGSGDNAFGGVKEWMAIKLHVACPIDMTQETAETLMHDMRLAVQKAGYHPGRL